MVVNEVIKPYRLVNLIYCLYTYVACSSWLLAHLLFHLRLFVGSSSIAEYHGIAVVSAAMLVHMQVSTQLELADDPCKDPKYQEPAVDAMRAEKDKVRIDECFKFTIHYLGCTLGCLGNGTANEWSHTLVPDCT